MAMENQLLDEIRNLNDDLYHNNINHNAIQEYINELNENIANDIFQWQNDNLLHGAVNNNVLDDNTPKIITNGLNQLYLMVRTGIEGYNRSLSNTRIILHEFNSHQLRRLQEIIPNVEENLQNDVLLNEFNLQINAPHLLRIYNDKRTIMCNFLLRTRIFLNMTLRELYFHYRTISVAILEQNNVNPQNVINNNQYNYILTQYYRFLEIFLRRLDIHVIQLHSRMIHSYLLVPEYILPRFLPLEQQQGNNIINIVKHPFISRNDFICINRRNHAYLYNRQHLLQHNYVENKLRLIFFNRDQCEIDFQQNVLPHEQLNEVNDPTGIKRWKQLIYAKKFSPNPMFPFQSDFNPNQTMHIASQQQRRVKGTNKVVYTPVRQYNQNGEVAIDEITRRPIRSGHVDFNNTIGNPNDPYADALHYRRTTDPQGNVTSTKILKRGKVIPTPSIQYYNDRHHTANYSIGDVEKYRTTVIRSQKKGDYKKWNDTDCIKSKGCLTKGTCDRTRPQIDAPEYPVCIRYLRFCSGPGERENVGKEGRYRLHPETNQCVLKFGSRHEVERGKAILTTGGLTSRNLQRTRNIQRGSDHSKLVSKAASTHSKMLWSQNELMQHVPIHYQRSQVNSNDLVANETSAMTDDEIQNLFNSRNQIILNIDENGKPIRLQDTDGNIRPLRSVPFNFEAIRNQFNNPQNMHVNYRSLEPSTDHITIQEYNENIFPAVNDDQHSADFLHGLNPPEQLPRAVNVINDTETNARDYMNNNITNNILQQIQRYNPQFHYDRYLGGRSNKSTKQKKISKPSKTSKISKPSKTSKTSKKQVMGGVIDERPNQQDDPENFH